MHLYLDARGYQLQPSPVDDPVLAVLRRARSDPGRALEIIGLVDKSRGPVPPAVRPLLDRLATFPRPPAGPMALLQPTPFAAEPSILEPLFRDGVFRCAFLADAHIGDGTLSVPKFGTRSVPSPMDRQTIYRAVWLKRYHRVVPASPDVALAVRDRLGLRPPQLDTAGPAALWATIRDNAVGAPRPRRRPTMAVAAVYPPAGDFVAEHTAASLRAIARSVDVDVYTDTPRPRPDPWVRRFHPLAEVHAWARTCDAVVFVIGNAAAHAAIMDWHRRLGGALVLHGEHLGHLWAGRVGRGGPAGVATRELGRPVGLAEAAGWLAEPAGSPARFLDGLETMARALVVHGQPARDALAARFGTSPAVLSHCLASSPTEPDHSSAARRRLGLRDSDGLALAFPDAAATCATEIVQALDLLHAWQVPCTVAFLAPPPKPARRLARTFGVRGRVWVPSERLVRGRYADFLLAADVGLPLRGSATGLVPDDLCACVAAGLPAVCAEADARLLEPPAFVTSVPDRLSPLRIAEALAAALARGRAAARHEAITFRDERSPERYAAALLRAVGLDAIG